MTAPQPRFGRYEVTRTLGTGSAGAVYRAFDRESRREVALKALAPELNSQPAARTAFLAGARAAQALRHPNLVPVYDFGDAEGRPFFTMELIRGRTLGAVLADEPRLPFGRLVEIFRGVCAAADYLHRGGQAHGRISPTTVMIKDSGRAVLLESDFSGKPAAPADDLYALGLIAGLLIAGSRFEAAPTEAALRELQPELP
ncbi:MAG: serine/threonine-protein kinase, partial [Dehalococcoidia bacterium]